MKVEDQVILYFMQNGVEQPTTRTSTYVTPDEVTKALDHLNPDTVKKALRDLSSQRMLHRHDIGDNGKKVWGYALPGWKFKT